MLTRQQTKTNTWVKPQLTWAKYGLTYTEFYIWDQGHFSLTRAHPAIARSTSAQRRLSRTVSRASTALSCQRRLTQETFRYGQEVKTDTKNTSGQVTYLDGRTPFVTFIFKYRDFSPYIYRYIGNRAQGCLQASCKLMV